MNQQIQERVIRVIAENQKISPQEIHLDQPIAELCEDSLDLVSLVFALEDEFDIDISEEAKEAKTIHDIVIGIETLMQMQSSETSTA